MWLCTVPAFPTATFIAPEDVTGDGSTYAPVCVKLSTEQLLSLGWKVFRAIVRASQAAGEL